MLYGSWHITYVITHYLTSPNFTSPDLTFPYLTSFYLSTPHKLLHPYIILIQCIWYGTNQWSGTAGGTEPYQNPHLTGAVTASMSSIYKVKQETLFHSFLHYFSYIIPVYSTLSYPVTSNPLLFHSILSHPVVTYTSLSCRTLSRLITL